MNEPKAPKFPIEIEQHGHKRVDNYAWLRDKNWQKFISGDLDFADSKVKEYLDIEASFTKTKMEQTLGLQEELYQEILGRLKEDDESYPFQKNDYWYFRRTEKGKNYPILCRRHGAVDGPTEIYLDINKLAEGHQLFMLGKVLPNEANTHVAYGYNLTGSLERSLRVRDLEKGQDLNFTIPETTGDFLWLDNENILFVERGPQSRGQRVYTFNIYQGEASRTLVYDKPDKWNSMFMSVGNTADKKYLFLYLSSGSKNSVLYSPVSHIEFKDFAYGENDTQFSVESRGGQFFILTNKDQKNNYQILTCPEESPEVENWNVFLPESKAHYLSQFDIYGQKLVLLRKNTEKALPELAIVDLQTKSEIVVSFPDDAYSMSLVGAHDYQAKKIRVIYESPRQPRQDIDLDVTSGKLEVLKTQFVPNFNPEKYTVKRAFAQARDGASIPLTIIHQKDLKKDGLQPALVYSYGSYGLGYPAHFSSPLFSLVDRGFTYVIAHIRGGDDKGYEWYLDGKLQNKKNTFHDFIDSCEYLIQEKFTEKGAVSINGGSAGGLLMGVVANMRPDLFKCVVADVAFVDMINTISDETLPLTPPEWEEWGNPIESRDDFEYMMSYSPYDNIAKKDYPAMLYNSGISDEQVTYWEPAKMVAKLRDLKTDNNLLLLNIKMHAGHAGASKRYERIKEVAFNYAFILSQQ